MRFLILRIAVLWFLSSVVLSLVLGQLIHRMAGQDDEWDVTARRAPAFESHRGSREAAVGRRLPRHGFGSAVPREGHSDLPATPAGLPRK